MMLEVDFLREIGQCFSVATDPTPIQPAETADLALEKVKLIIIGIAAAAAVASFAVSTWSAISSKKLLVKLEKQRQAGNYFVTWPSSNRSLFEDKSIAKLESKIHPYDKIGRKSAKKIHYFFEMLNRAYALHHNIQLGDEESAQSESLIRNICNITFPDRAFIKKNVLPRGYAKSFEAYLDEKWAEIERGGEWPAGVLQMK